MFVVHPMSMISKQAQQLLVSACTDSVVYVSTVRNDKFTVVSQIFHPGKPLKIKHEEAIT